MVHSHPNYVDALPVSPFGSEESYLECDQLMCLNNTNSFFDGFIFYWNIVDLQHVGLRYTTQ